MASVDRLTLVELIEAQKAKLSPEALELWEDLDTSVYMSTEETRLGPHEDAIMKRMAQMPEEDPYIIDLLSELRVGLYESDYSERWEDPSQPQRDKCVISASIIEDRPREGSPPCIPTSSWAGP